MHSSTRAACLTAAAIGIILAHRFPHWSVASLLSNQGDDVLHAISGSTASALSNTLLYPLETIRTRLQVDTSMRAYSSFYLIYTIGRSEGIIRGLYKGCFSLVVTLMFLNFVYFYFFHGLRRWVGATLGSSFVDSFMVVHEGTETPPSAAKKVAVDLISGYLAGVVAVLVTGPLWLVNTRLKLQGLDIGQADSRDAKTPQHTQYRGILHCLYKVSREEGMLTLWKGTFTSIILALNPAIQLGFYEMLKRIVTNGSDNTITSGASFVNSFVAKFVATIVTYPIQVLQTRQRAGIKQDAVATNTPQNRTRSWYSAILELYRGLESKLLQTCLNSAIMFVAYERLVDFLRLLQDK